MKLPLALLASVALAAVAPLFARHAVAPPIGGKLPAWPHEFRGRPLIEVPMSIEERRFIGDFPGAVARFSDGENDIIMRWVSQPTRRLHPAEDCYRGWGYEVSQSRIHEDRDGTRWRCFTAFRVGRERDVCEQLSDADGRHFTDISAWYWAATLRRTTGPWLSTTVAR
jgi:hypothetical protein